MIRATESYGWYPRHHTPAKLTPADREEIGFQRGDGIPVTALAAQYGVSTATIRTITPRNR